MGIPLIAEGDLKDLLQIDPAERKYPIVVGSPFQEDRQIRILYPGELHVKSLPRDRYIENKLGSLQVLCIPGSSDLRYYSRLIIKDGTVPADEASLLLDILRGMEAAGKDVIILERQTAE